MNPRVSLAFVFMKDRSAFVEQATDCEKSEGTRTVTERQ